MMAKKRVLRAPAMTSYIAALSEKRVFLAGASYAPMPIDLLSEKIDQVLFNS